MRYGMSFKGNGAPYLIHDVRLQDKGSLELETDRKETLNDLSPRYLSLLSRVCERHY